MFLPLVITVWLFILGMGLWQSSVIRDYRESQIRDQVNLIDARIIDACVSGDTTLMNSFLQFADSYYSEDSLYKNIRVTIYKNMEVEKVLGEPIILSQPDLARAVGVQVDTNLVVDLNMDQDRYLYFKSHTTDDGEYTVCTALPMSKAIEEKTSPGSVFFYALIVVALAMSVVAFVASRHIARNIRFLREIARRAATDPKFIPMMDFPHDELGDINRQIVHLYNERTQAMLRQKREHAVAMNAIEEKARAKRQMSSNINHELRTPIGVIKGYLDTLVDNPDMDADTRMHFIRKAREHALRLVSLISDVSAITRLEEGGEVINTEELNFHDLVYTMADDIEESNVLGDMKFTFDIPLDCTIQGNTNLLNGMLMNLARNAAAYSKGTECSIVLKEQDDDFYTFVFADNGQGVGEEHIPHLFERFYRVDSGRARKSGGTGLGLPIVQSTVTAHGGTITISNLPTGGLAFTFTIPKAGHHTKKR